MTLCNWYKILFVAYSPIYFIPNSIPKSCKTEMYLDQTLYSGIAVWHVFTFRRYECEHVVMNIILHNWEFPLKAHGLCNKPTANINSEWKIGRFSSKTKKKPRITTLKTWILHRVGSSCKCNNATEKMKGIQIGKLKKWNYCDLLRTWSYMQTNLYVPQKKIKRLFELLNKFTKITGAK
jgi:hypothetical protein